MKSHYKSILLLLLIVFCGSFSWSQNTPNLVQTYPPGAATEIQTPPSPPSAAEGNWFNFVRVYTPTAPTANSTAISESSPVNEVKITSDYLDGFGRPIQKVIRNFTTNVAKNLVVPTDSRFKQGVQHSFLPYATPYDNTGNPDQFSIYQGNAFQLQRDYYSQKFPNEGYTAYSSQTYNSDANTRKFGSFDAGKSKIGQTNGIQVIRKTNDAGTIKIWTIDGSGNPIAIGYYSENNLFGEEAIDAEGGKTISFNNRDGRIVYSAKLLNIINSVAEYATTYYVYDDLGRLRFTLTPKAVEAIGSSSSIDTAILNQLCFQYKYDNLGRAVEVRYPDRKAGTSYVYDQRQRIVMSQTALQKADKKWEVFFYDKLGRLTSRSLFNTVNNRQYWQNQLDNPPANPPSNDLLYYLAGSGEGIQPTDVAVPNNEMLEYLYFDSYANTIDNNGNLYDLAENTLLFANDLVNTSGAEIPSRSLRSHGRVTSTKTKILHSPNSSQGIGNWRYTLYYYDDKGRVIYLANFDKVSNQGQLDYQRMQLLACQYDFSDNLILSKHYVRNKLAHGGQNEYTEFEKREFEASTGRLLKVSHKIDNKPWNILSMYSYDELGRMSRKILGNYGETQDFTYDIRGNLSAINGVYAETGNKQGFSRSFGQTLKSDFGFSKVRKDGRITGMIWRGSGNMQAYGYDYDLSGRLKSADYRSYSTQAPQNGWDNAYDDRSVSNVTYDKNGNLKSLKQRAKAYNTTAQQFLAADMDQLSYTYNANSNKLLRVDDAVNTATLGLGDFQNGNSSNQDYDYDDNGNLKYDLNKSVSNIEYNHFDKPVRISFNSGAAIECVYDASGEKIQELLLNGSGGNTKLDYIGNFTYKNDSISTITTSEGRTIFDVANDKVKEEFFVRDYLGNVRSVVDVYNYPILEYLATYEVASANLENLFFEKIDEVRDGKPIATTQSDQHSARLNGGESDRRIGTSMLMKVMAGDKVEMNVNNFYDGFDSREDHPVNPEEMLSSVISTLTGGSGGLPGEAHDTKLVTEAFTSDNYLQFNNLIASNTEPTKPKAFLNYILFDENMRIVQEMAGAFQATGNGAWESIGTSVPMEIPANGYFAVYLSNSTRSLSCMTCADVYFDALNIKLSRGKLKDEDHYYPHGLPMALMGSTAPGQLPNNTKYQSNQYQKSYGLDMMDFHYRQYDPQIAKFASIDPMATDFQSESPYSAMANNPVHFTDPYGLSPIIILYFMMDEVVITASRSGTGQTGTTVRNTSNGNPFLPGADPWAPRNDGGGNGDLLGQFNNNGGGGGGPTSNLTPPTNLPGSPLSPLTSLMGPVAVPLPQTIPIPIPAVNPATAAAAATVLSIYTWEQLLRRLSEKTHVTYVKRGPAGQVYVGRTSGIGTPQQIVEARDRYHHMDLLGYGKATVDVSVKPMDKLPGVPGDPRLITAVSAYTAIRGREQQLYDHYMLRGYVIGNSIRPVSMINPLGPMYHAASTLTWGEIAPYTGIVKYSYP